MGFGLTPKHNKDFPVENMTSEQFLIIAIETAEKLNWDIGHISEAGFIAYTEFSMSSWSEEVRVKIDGNVASLKSECTGSQIIDWGKNKENINDFIYMFNELKDKYTHEELEQKYEEIKPKLAHEEKDALSKSPLSAKEKLTGFLSVFKPTKGYFVTPVIININIAVFILMILMGVNAFFPDGESLVKWGANFRPSTLDGEWWRLITNCFLHIGVLHLLMNMYALIYIGLLLEPYLGKARFAAAYLLTGIFASVASLCWHDLTISAGASGAIFGMYGVFLAMLTTNLIEKSARKALMTSIVIFVGYNLFNGFKDGIDNAAHIGGLISGLVIGYAYFPGLKKAKDIKLKYITIGILSVVILSVSVITYNQIPNDIGKYESGMKEFSAMEEKAMEVYKLPENISNEKILSEVKNGLHYWDESIKLLNELDRLNLPEEIHERNKKMLQYCDLRVKSYNLIYKTISENTNIYRQEIDECNNQIENIINELNE